MLTRKSALLFAVVTAIVMLFTYTDAGAIANGNGVCEQAELDNFDCANLADNTMEFLGSADTTCTPDTSTVPCTAHFYLYTGDTTNQVNVAIPLKLTVAVNNDPAVIQCSQYITDGGGDPTTGFGENLLQLGICRLAFSLGSLPIGIIPPGANFAIVVDPTVTDPSMPLAWQANLPGGKKRTTIIPFLLNGPTFPAGVVTTAAETVTTTEGNTVSYEIQGGQVTNVVGGRLIPVGEVKFCIPIPIPLNDPPKFPDDFTCEFIEFATNECDIKTTGEDPCRRLGGSFLCW